MWYNDVSLLRSFGIALANCEYLESSEDFAAFLNKPQNYNDEYEAWVQNGYPTNESDDGWEEFVDAISDET